MAKPDYSRAAVSVSGREHALEILQGKGLHHHRAEVRAPRPFHGSRVPAHQHEPFRQPGVAQRAAGEHAVATVLRVEPADLLPRTKGRRAPDPSLAAIDSVLARLKPGKRRFLMGVVRDLADEFER